MISNPEPESSTVFGATIETFNFCRARRSDSQPKGEWADDVIWIAWERQRRTLELSRSLGIKLYRLIYKGFSPFRYPVLAFHTLKLIFRNRPKTLIVQNPSLLLSAFAVVLKLFFSYSLIVDRHTNFMINREKSLFKTIFTALSDFTLKHSELTIVTNSPLAELVESKGGKPFVLPDRIPYMKPAGGYSLSAGRNICFICTFAKDEPFEEVIAMAPRLPANTSVLITGNPAKVQFSRDTQEILSNNSNVVLTGYLSDDEYSNLLFAVDAIMDLTTLDFCLVCGAYEGIAARKPLILSDKLVNHELFGDAPQYVGPTRNDILQGINNTLADLDGQKRKTEKLRIRFEKYWENSFSDLITLIASYSV